MRNSHPFAERLRQRTTGYGGITHLVDAAALLRSIADELEAYEDERSLESLTLPEASRESGYSASHIGRMVAEAKLTNVGTGRVAKVRRCDLPRKRPLSENGAELMAKVGTGVRRSRK